MSRSREGIRVLEERIKLGLGAAEAACAATWARAIAICEERGERGAAAALRAAAREAVPGEAGRFGGPRPGPCLVQRERERPEEEGVRLEALPWRGAP